MTSADVSAVGSASRLQVGVHDVGVPKARHEGVELHGGHVGSLEIVARALGDLDPFVSATLKGGRVEKVTKWRQADPMADFRIGGDTRRVYALLDDVCGADASVPDMLLADGATVEADDVADFDPFSQDDPIGTVRGKARRDGPFELQVATAYIRRRAVVSWSAGRWRRRSPA